MSNCECEHEAHLEKDKDTPNGNPGHNYFVPFHDLAIKKVKTPFGTFKVCIDCAKDCLMEYTI